MRLVAYLLFALACTDGVGPSPGPTPPPPPPAMEEGTRRTLVVNDYFGNVAWRVRP